MSAEFARAFVDLLDDDAVDALARRLGPRLQAVTSSSPSPWLDAGEAAEYLRCPVSRVRKLTSTGDLPAHRDGRRVLYRRDELDDFIVAGGALSP